MDIDKFKNAEARLWELIQERVKIKADQRSAIDDRIWDLFGEEWCIMFTDLSGFSRRVEEFGILHFLQIIFESKRILLPIIEGHDGFLLKIEGDSFLVIFRNPLKALQCALNMQTSLVFYNQNLSNEDKVLLCIGLGHGKVLRIGESEVFGAEVNAASKLGEDTAKAGEILITEAFKKRIELREDLSFEKLKDAPPGSSGAYRVLY